MRFRWDRKTVTRPLKETGAPGGSRACVCVARPCGRARRRCRHPRRVERPIIVLRWQRTALNLACSWWWERIQKTHPSRRIPSLRCSLRRGRARWREVRGARAQGGSRGHRGGGSGTLKYINTFHIVWALRSSPMIVVVVSMRRDGGGNRSHMGSDQVVPVPDWGASPS